MLKINFYDKVEDEKLKFAVILSKAEGKWVFCKHKDRNTYEVPGGHREENESILEAAVRELKEETGAIEFDMKPVCIYSVEGKVSNNESIVESYGMLYFATIYSFEKDLHSEIEKIILAEKIPDD